MKNVLLFKGEEKVNADQLQTAINEPVDKFSMLDPILFGSIQFMICYAATGHKVCSRQDQIIPLRKVINITHIMVTVWDIIPIYYGFNYYSFDGTADFEMDSNYY